MINNSLRAVLAAEANEDGQADSDKKKVKYIYFWAWIENYYVISTLKVWAFEIAGSVSLAMCQHNTESFPLLACICHYSCLILRHIH